MKKTTFLWHLAGWLAYAGYEVAGCFVEPGRVPLAVGIPLTLNTVGLRLVEFYLCHLLIFPHLLRPGRAVALVAALLGAGALYIGLRFGIEEVLFPAVLGFHNYFDGTTPGYYIFDNLYYASPAIAVAGAVWAGQQALRRGQENRQLLAEKQRAETAFLKSQINPHFLYNTLNLLYGMAYPVARPLAAAILQLAELMRYMLRDSPDGLVELSEEIEYLHHFLALYRLRFPDQFFVSFVVTGASAGHRIAPLLLIPFVENACKHGVLDQAAQPVRIDLTISPEELTFAVRNRISDYAKDASSGIGLANLRRRLALLYPGGHTLRVGAENGQFDTLLRVSFLPGVRLTP